MGCGTFFKALLKIGMMVGSVSLAVLVYNMSYRVCGRIVTETESLNSSGTCSFRTANSNAMSAFLFAVMAFLFLLILQVYIGRLLDKIFPSSTAPSNYDWYGRYNNPDSDYHDYVPDPPVDRWTSSSDWNSDSNSANGGVLGAASGALGAMGAAAVQGFEDGMGISRSNK